MVDGLLLNTMITGGVPTTEVAGDWNVIQLEMRINNNSEKERRASLFN
jgi:hypothetical protein